MAGYRALLFSLLLAAPLQAETPLLVEAVAARLAPDVRVDALVGEIAARETLTASFAASGRIASVEVEEGDRVEAGAVLARMESVQQEQALRAAEAGVTTASAGFRQAREDFDRQAALLERGATTRIDRDAAEDALTIAEGELARAQAELARAQKALADTELHATSDATVTARMVDEGQVVGAAQPVLELAIGAGLDAVFEVPEALLTVGGTSPEITLNLLDRPGDPFAGEVRYVAPLVDSRNGTVEVKVAIDARPDNIAYGDAVRGTARRARAEHFVLPYSAMSTTKDGPAVWTVDPASSTVSLRQVEIDRFETGKIIIRSGLEEGALVVTRGAQLLFPGRAVTVSEAAQ